MVAYPGREADLPVHEAVWATDVNPYSNAALLDLLDDIEAIWEGFRHPGGSHQSRRRLPFGRQNHRPGLHPGGLRPIGLKSKGSRDDYRSIARFSE